MAEALTLGNGLIMIIGFPFPEKVIHDPLRKEDPALLKPHPIGPSHDLERMSQ